MQCLHYLTLATLIPPLLAVFAESTSLEYEGGSANVGEGIIPLPPSCVFPTIHAFKVC